MRGLIFPSTTGTVVLAFRTGLTASGLPYATGVTVQPELPAAKTIRMVTVRDDSGPDDGAQTRRRQGVNVWAEDSVTAENLALLLMAIARNMPNGQPITATDQFSGPFRIDDETPVVVASKPLEHYYFTFRLSARGSGF